MATRRWNGDGRRHSEVPRTFDGRVDDTDSGENRGLRYPRGTTKSTLSRSQSTNSLRSTYPIDRHVRNMRADGIPFFQGTNGGNRAGCSSRGQHSTRKDKQHTPESRRISASEVSENHRYLLDMSSLFKSPFELQPFDVGDQHSVRRTSAPEESSHESYEDWDPEITTAALERSEDADQASKWVDKATKEAQITRIKRHCCLVPPANDEINEAINPNEGSSRAVSDYHNAVHSISTGNRECLYKQHHTKRHLANRFTSPVNLYDGGIDSDDELRRESHLSQGFIMYGNRMNFARASHHRVLVTGGAGFIGSHLVIRLLELGHSVVVLDNLITGSLSNLRHFDGHPQLVYINHDILNPLPKHLIVDEVFHLACPGSPFFWQTNLINTFGIIVEGTRNVLDFAQRSGAKVLFASTTEVYGNPELGVEFQPESYKGSVECFAARACHDEAKRAAETLCYGYQAERRVKIRIARIGSTYGPYMGHCDGSMISSFTSALVDSVDVKISHSDNAPRTFLYVADCVNGLIRLMNSSYPEPMNLAGNEVLSVGDLLLQLTDLVANPSNAVPWNTVSFSPDSGTRRPAIDLAFRHLGWCPEVKIKQGLKSTVIWFKADKAKRLAAKANMG